MTTIPFYQVIGWVQTFIRNTQQKGMSGSIVRDRDEQLQDGDLASWSGEKHQLAFRGTPEEYTLVLRKIEGQTFIDWYEQADSTQFVYVVIDFFSLEG